MTEDLLDIKEINKRLRYWMRRAELWEEMYLLKDVDCQRRDELWHEIHGDLDA